METNSPEPVVVPNETPVSDKESFLKAVDPGTGLPRPDAVPAKKEEPEKPETPKENTETVKPEEGDAGKVEEKPKPSTETVEKTEKPSLDEVLKGLDPKEVFKHLGLDDTDIAFHEHRKGGNDITEYLAAQTRDWGAMSDQDVLRHDLKKQFPNLSGEDFEILAEKRIGGRLPDQFTDEKEKKLAALELKLDADKLREKYKAEDEKLKAAKREAEPDTKQAEAEAEKARLRQEWLDNLTVSDVTKKLLAEKQIVIGEGPDAHKYPVDLADIMPYVTEEGKFWTMLQGEDGQMDLTKMYKLINYGKNMDAYEKSLIDHGKSLGTKAEEEELHNLPKDDQPKPGDKKESLHDAFLTRGKDVPN
jgi:hypothetical protein